MSRRAWLWCIPGLSLTGVLVAMAGPLDPPPGPVAGSYKTLSEVEPRTAINATNTPPGDGSLFLITQPGSYYLTGNIVGSGSLNGVGVAASGVTIDLMGFEVRGVPGTGSGIITTRTNLRNITVRNGHVRNWGGSGVALGASAPLNTSVLNVSAHGNAGAGIAVGASSLLRDCVVTANGGDGISAGANAVILACVADNNGANLLSGGAGIAVGNASTLSACTSQNTTSALFGGVGDFAVGFRIADRCAVVDCTAGRNRGHGFRLGSSNRISACASVENGSGSTVSAGVYVAGSDNKIENTNAVGCDFGVQVISAGNLIVRNSASGNGTNYSFVQNNIYGPVVDRRIPEGVASTPAVSGSSASSTLGTTDANANIAY